MGECGLRYTQCSSCHKTFNSNTYNQEIQCVTPVFTILLDSNSSTCAYNVPLNIVVIHERNSAQG